MIPPLDYSEPDWSAYWAAAIARHKAMIAAGCVSPVGAIRVGVGPKAKDDDPVDEEGS